MGTHHNHLSVYYHLSKESIARETSFKIVLIKFFFEYPQTTG